MHGEVDSNQVRLEQVKPPIKWVISIISVVCARGAVVERREPGRQGGSDRQLEARHSELPGPRRHLKRSNSLAHQLAPPAAPQDGPFLVFQSCRHAWPANCEAPCWLTEGDAVRLSEAKRHPRRALTGHSTRLVQRAIGGCHAHCQLPASNQRCCMPVTAPAI